MNMEHLSHDIFEVVWVLCPMMAKLIYMLFHEEIDLNQDLMCSNNTVLTDTVLVEGTYVFYPNQPRCLLKGNLFYSNFFKGKICCLSLDLKESKLRRESQTVLLGIPISNTFSCLSFGYGIICNV